jgi:hypothetical protein
VLSTFLEILLYKARNAVRGLNAIGQGGHQGNADTILAWVDALYGATDVTTG